jgi:hypothetical protein
MSTSALEKVSERAVTRPLAFQNFPWVVGLPLSLGSIQMKVREGMANINSLTTEQAHFLMVSTCFFSCCESCFITFCRQWQAISTILACQTFFLESGSFKTRAITCQPILKVYLIPGNGTPCTTPTSYRSLTSSYGSCCWTGWPMPSASQGNHPKPQLTDDFYHAMLPKNLSKYVVASLTRNSC